MAAAASQYSGPQAITQGMRTKQRNTPVSAHWKLVASMACWLLALTASVLGVVLSVQACFPYIPGLGAGCAAGEACSAVAYSRYSHLSGVPISFIGVVYYSMVLLMLSFTGLWPRLVFFATLLVAGGTVASCLLVLLMHFAIGELCERCLGSALASGILALCMALGVRAPKVTVPGRIVLAGPTLVALALVYALVAEEREHVALLESYFPTLQGDALFGETRSDHIRFGEGTTEIVMFVDMRCGACLTEIRNLKRRAQFGENLRVTVLHFPLSMDSVSFDLACVAEQYQSAWVLMRLMEDGLDHRPKSQREVSSIADSILSGVRLESRFSIAEAANRVRENVAIGRHFGLQGTPAVFIVAEKSAKRVIVVPFQGRNNTQAVVQRQ